MEQSLMAFEINNNDFSIELERVIAIVHDLDCTSISNCHYAIDGMVDYLDTVITQVNLHRLMFSGYSELDSKQEILLICNVANRQIAFKIDKVLGIIKVNMTDIYKLDKIISTDANRFIIGAFKQKDTINQILDVDRILNEIVVI